MLLCITFSGYSVYTISLGLHYRKSRAERSDAKLPVSTDLSLAPFWLALSDHYRVFFFIQSPKLFLLLNPPSINPPIRDGGMKS